MYFERFVKLADGGIMRRVERQLGLAEWEQQDSGCWVRKTKEWKTEDNLER